MLFSFIIDAILVIILFLINNYRGKESVLSDGKLGWYSWYINPWVPLIIWSLFAIFTLKF
jgi:hypothetical protein